MTIADDALAIQNVKARYCAVIDALTHDTIRAAEIFRIIFTPDIVADYGHGELVGAEALASFLCDGIAGNSEWRIHMLHSPLIAVDGDSATAEWTVMVHLKRPGGVIDVLIGRYSDAFARSPEGWRIARVGFSREL
jgi:hypothetical protein